MSNERDEEFLSRARAELERSARELDELSVARLRAARRRALAAPPRRLGWLAAGGVVATAVTAGLVATVVLTPAAVPTANGLDQIELLADADLDVYDNLEFYRWLAEQQRAG
jgi:hypothetical protein